MPMVDADDRLRQQISALETEIIEIKKNISKYKELKQKIINAKLSDEDIKFINWAYTNYKSAIIGVENNYTESSIADEKIKNMYETLDKIETVQTNLENNKEQAVEMEQEAQREIEYWETELDLKEAKLKGKKEELKKYTG